VQNGEGTIFFAIPETLLSARERGPGLNKVQAVSGKRGGKRKKGRDQPSQLPRCEYASEVYRGCGIKRKKIPRPYQNAVSELKGRISALGMNRGKV